MRTLFIVLLTLLFSIVTPLKILISGEIYKWVDKDGVVHFSDSISEPSVLEGKIVKVRKVPDSKTEQESKSARVPSKPKTEQESKSARVPSKPKTEQESKPAGIADYYKDKKLSPRMQERIRYEQYLIKKNNVPIVVSQGDILREVNRRAVKRERALFENCFGKLYRYEDRNNLDPQASAHWRNAKLKDRQVIKSSLEKIIKEAIAKHKDMMREWDNTIGKEMEEKAD